MVESQQVTVIEGETGCGKTTQVPQYILDYYAAQGRYCNIIVTQPRRIAAISIARRVCAERRWQLGHICGYQVLVVVTDSLCQSSAVITDAGTLAAVDMACVSRLPVNSPVLKSMLHQALRWLTSLSHLEHQPGQPCVSGPKPPHLPANKKLPYSANKYGCQC